MSGDLSSVIVGGIVFAVFLIVSTFILIITRYKKCPSDKILVIYGKVKKETSAKCIHGGAAFVVPLIQSHQYLDLTPMSIEVNLTNALSKQNIRVDVPSRFTVGISTDHGIMEKAAERLLGLKHHDIIELSKDILFGQLRLVIATMDIEEINTDRDKFLDNVSKNVEAELNKIGLKLINVNVTDIRDESKYIEALGKEAAAKAINDAKVSVAERDRDGSIGEAEANQDKKIQVAEAETLADTGVAEAESRKRISVAAANAEAVNGENLSKIKIAESESERNTKQAQAENRALAAQRIAVAEAEKKGYDARKIAEEARASMEKMTQKADIIVAAEIEKEKIVIAAEAEAERIRRIAQGNADAKLKQMQAEALGLFQILEKKADGFRQLVNAAGNSSDMAIKLLLAEQMTDLLGIQAQAVKDLNIDQVTVWSNGNEKGDSSVSGHVHDLFSVLPPLQDILTMKGMGLPEFLAKTVKKEQEDLEVEKPKPTGNQDKK
ncbi:MAG: flotillin family protein [Candidatus Cloacimonetes bacterium]|nr:flotillin family protein [Candidatus Cloacimonadota bacterium]